MMYPSLPHEIPEGGGGGGSRTYNYYNTVGLAGNLVVKIIF